MFPKDAAVPEFCGFARGTWIGQDGTEARFLESWYHGLAYRNSCRLYRCSDSPFNERSLSDQFCLFSILGNLGPL